MIITREKGMRMWGGGSGSTSASGVNGGGGFSLAVEEGEGTGNAYTGFTYESGVLSLIKGEKFVTVDFFNRLFTAYDSDGNAILPNDVTSTINNLKLLVGTWTEEYLSALGKNSEGGGGGGGIELSDVWQSLKTNTDDYANQKINSAHIPDLSGTYATKTWVNQQGFVTSSGVTSVAMTVPTGLSVSGSPITSTGTLALTFTSGYSIPTTAKQSNWDTAYGWGNHATAGYAMGTTKIIAGNGLTGGGTLAADRTLSIQLQSNSGLAVSSSGLKLDIINNLTTESAYKAISATQAKKIWDLLNQMFTLEGAGTTASPYVIKANYGLYTEQFLSALGQNSSGGGSGDFDEAQMWAALQSTSGTYATTKIATSHIPDMASTYGYVKSSGVTSVATGTGLTGGTITSTGTISINSTYQTYISNGNTAYGWGNHATAGYASASSVTTLEGYFTNGVAKTAAKLNTGTTTYTAWGQTYWSSGVPQSISGNMTSVGSITPSANGNALGTTSARFNIYGTAGNFSGNVSIGGTLGVTGATTLTGLLTANGGIVVPSSKTIKIGDCTISWDSTNSMLKFDTGIYSTGAVSALGANSSGGGGGGVDLTAVWASLTNTENPTYSTTLKINSNHIPNLDASKITSGTFAAARIPVATASAVGGIKVGTTLAISDGVLNQKSGIATAGTYKSVTIDTYGRVTAGTNPTTLAGYGITDAKIASGTITLGSNTITPLTSSSSLAWGKLTGTPTTLSGYGVLADANDRYFALYDGTNLSPSSSNAVDLNTITDTGSYYVSNSTTAQYVSNRPVTGSHDFRLWVIATIGTSANYKRQRYARYDNNNVYERYTTNGGTSWSTWELVQANLTNYALASSLDNYLPLSGGTMTGAVTFKAGNATSTSQGFNLGTTAHVGASSTGVGIYSTGSILIRPNQTLGEAATSAGLSITNTSLTYNTYPILHSNNYDSYALPLSGGTMTGSITFNAINKGIYLKDSDGNTFAGIIQNSENLWIGAQQTSATHHTGGTYISAGGNRNLYVSKLVNNTRTNYIILDTDNTYTSSGKGYINGTEITTITGNAATATTLATARKIWGQSFNGGAAVKDTLYMLSSSATTLNSDSAKLKFNSYAADGDDIRRSPYLQAVGSYSGYGRKRLGIFQSNAANYTDDFNEVLSILPTGNIGIGTTAPSYKLHVVGTAYASSAFDVAAGSISTLLGYKVAGGTVLRATSANGNVIISPPGTGGAIYFYSKGSGDNSVFSTIANNGNVGIGTDSPSQKLHVTGNILASGDVTASSDERLKTIVGDGNLDLRYIANAPNILFKWNNGQDDKVHGGSLAQYFLHGAKHFVLGSDKDFYSLNYGALATSMAISIAKEVVKHEDEITRLKKIVVKQAEEIVDLKNKVSEFEERRA